VSTGYRTVLLSDRDRIRAFLETDRIYSAYAIGDLEPELFAKCVWAGAEDGAALRSLALLFGGVDPPAFFLMGDADGLAAVFARTLHPGKAGITCRTAHLPAVEKYYRWESRPQEMERMILRNPALPLPAAGCIRLTEADAGPLGGLLAAAHAAGFAPDQIGRGVFYGIHRDGELVSAAGTHLVSPQSGIAAIGNVATRPDFRGRGLATAAAGAVLGELIRSGIRDVFLNVRSDNDAARRVYGKLGFAAVCPYREGTAFSRGANPRNDPKEP
jgi:ribosomal protein S18 acetylase RimI-like enzyme